MIDRRIRFLAADKNMDKRPTINSAPFSLLYDYSDTHFTLPFTSNSCFVLNFN